MKLKNRIIRRVSAFLIAVLTMWAILFYVAMIDEITDEVDDAIDLYAEEVITRYLAGKELPSIDNGTNNSYHLKEVSDDYARTHSHLSYVDETLYIEAKQEFEPARVMRTIFRNAKGQLMELTVITPTIEKKDLMESIAYWVFWLYVAVLLTIIIVNAWVISNSMRPLYRLLGWLDKYTINEHVQTLDNPTSVTEFQILNDVVNRFSQRNSQLFEQQKRFIGDASHELQTPIAICQNRLEMLCDTELSEEQMGEIIKTLQTLEHMSELNRSLLLLSKIDNHQFLDKIPVDMVSLITQAKKEYRYMALEHGVSVMIDDGDAEGANHPCWMLNPTLAKVLVYNLFRNALIHNVESGGELFICIRDNGEIIFSNTGSSIPLDKEHIFERFYKFGGREGSTGLGLAIVASICTHSDLKIDYQFIENRHQFILSRYK